MKSTKSVLIKKHRSG